MKPVNRVEVCPTLVRTFYQKSVHHTLANFLREFPSPEVYIYTWKDATLLELSYAIMRAAKLNDVQKISFNMLIPNLAEGGWIIKQLDEVDLKESDDVKTDTLATYGFEPGYMLDVAYTVAG